MSKFQIQSDMTWIPFIFDNRTSSLQVRHWKLFKILPILLQVSLLENYFDYIFSTLTVNISWPQFFTLFWIGISLKVPCEVQLYNLVNKLWTLNFTMIKINTNWSFSRNDLFDRTRVSRNNNLLKKSYPTEILSRHYIRL